MQGPPVNNDCIRHKCVWWLQWLSASAVCVLMDMAVCVMLCVCCWTSIASPVFDVLRSHNLLLSSVRSECRAQEDAALTAAWQTTSLMHLTALNLAGLVQKPLASRFGQGVLLVSCGGMVHSD